MGTRTLTLSKLNLQDWEQSDVTWNNIDADIAQVGPSFQLKKNQKNTWFEINITDLITDDDDNSKLILFLENRGSATSESHVYIGTLERGDDFEYAPRLRVQAGVV